MTPSPPNIPHTGGDRYARQTTPMPVYSPPGKNEDLISAPWLRLYIPPPAGKQHYRTRFCMPGHDIPPDRGGIPRAVQPEGRGRTYSLRRGEPRPEKCAMPRPPVCLTPMGGTLKKAACARSAPCPACIRGCVRRFPEGPLPGTGGVLFLPRSRGGGNLLFLYRAEYVLFRQARLHAMAWRFREKKDDVKRKSPYDVSS